MFSCAHSFALQLRKKHSKIDLIKLQKWKIEKKLSEQELSSLQSQFPFYSLSEYLLIKMRQ